jgi:predicted amidophosphoribosyltransferase
MRLQSVIRAIYPLACVSCDAPVEGAQGLCPTCWSQTEFITGLACDTCGAPLPGQDDGTVAQCDDCLTIARPWAHGRAVLTYSGVGRRLVLALKHGDRTDLVPTLAGWMARKGVSLAPEGSVVVPVPLHWSRLLRRRYNQAGLLSQGIGKALQHEVCVDALLRPKRTAALDGHSRDQRFVSIAGSIKANPKRVALISGRPVLLVDDVMTSGATLAAATEALHAAGAADVSILTLARVVKSP